MNGIRLNISFIILLFKYLYITIEFVQMHLSLIKIHNIFCILILCAFCVTTVLFCFVVLMNFI